MYNCHAESTTTIYNRFTHLPRLCHVAEQHGRHPKITETLLPGFNPDFNPFFQPGFNRVCYPVANRFATRFATRFQPGLLPENPNRKPEPIRTVPNRPEPNRPDRQNPKP